MSIPSVYHYLPHLIGKPSSLKPAIKLSKGRAGGECFSFSLFFFIYFLHISVDLYKVRVFSARQHAERAICYRKSVRLSVCPSVRLSVCLSVRHTGGSVKNG